MEEILEKDIFKDEVLKKLSPDYSPTDVILRLQTRRSLVKDTHCHRIRRQSSSTRKRSNSYSVKPIVNQEITKIKSSYQTKDLKNSMELKRCKKKMHYPKMKSSEYDDLGFVEDENEHQGFLDTKESFEMNSNDDFDAFEINRVFCNKGIDTKNFKEHFDNIDDIKYLTETKTRPENKFSTSTDEIKYPTNDLQSILIEMAVNSYSIKEQNVYEAGQDLEQKKTISNGEETSVKIINDKKIEAMDFMKITSLKEKLGEKERHLLQKYASKWREWVKRKNDLDAKRQSAINEFFNKLEKKKNCKNGLTDSENKAALLARDYKTYQHRYKLQKHIIAIQKAKLEEQNRMIDELKYNKIVEASKLSVDAMKEEVRKTYYEMDRQLKPKIKCLTNELKLHEIEEPSLVLHCLKVPQFLQRMEKRAREREEKHAIIRERRQQMEEERIRMKQQMELAKVEMDKEEKIIRMKELKQKRKKEKLESIRKKQHAEKMRALIVLADLHYEKNLQNRLGLQPLKKLLEIRKHNIEIANSHYKFQLVKNVFLHWMWYTEEQSYERNFVADNFYKKKMMGRVFSALKINHHELVLKKQVAEDYYDFYVAQLIFRKFKVGIAVSQHENDLKMQKAIAYHNSNLKFKLFTCWRTLPALNALKREQEARKSRWREKVLQVVPDYAPPDD